MYVYLNIQDPTTITTHDFEEQYFQFVIQPARLTVITQDKKQYFFLFVI